MPRDEKGIETCKALLELIDDIPERGRDFARGVRATVTDVLKQAEVWSLRDKQYAMLENIRRGVEKWTR